MAKKSKMIKVHVTHDENKRIISFQKGGEVKEFRHLFLQVFSDVLLDQVAPANVKLQRYDDSFDEYVGLSNEETLEEDLKLRALVSKQDRQKETPRAHEEAVTSDHPHSCPGPHTHLVFYRELYPSSPTKRNSYDRPHEVEPNTNYRMWSLVSRKNDSLVQRDSNDNFVNCEGAFSDKTAVVTTSDFNQDYISLLFKDLKSNQQYVMTAAQADSNDNIKIEAVKRSTDLNPDQAKFAPRYYWSYTLFENKWYNQKYLSCDSNGNMTLVHMASLDYPTPQALFILNKEV